MKKFSLLYPNGSNYETKVLDEAACNDLSFDFLLDALTKEKSEKQIIKRILSQMVSDEKVIKYRIDIFDDLLHHPKMCETLENLLTQLSDLWELKRMQKDTEVSAIWGLINRLREVNDYIQCITQMKLAMDEADLKSDGLKELYAMVTEIYNGSGFPQLKKDIDETFAKAQKLKSVTVGVNLDNLLRPKEAGVVSLNDAEFTHTGLLKNFMNFAAKKTSEIHEGVEVESMNFHPAATNKKTSLTGMSINNVAELSTLQIESSLTGGDPFSAAMEKSVSNILKKIVKDIRDVLRKYVDISGYSLTSISPELIFYIRWASLIRKIQNLNLPICKPQVLPTSQRVLQTDGLYNLKLAIKAVNGEDIDIVTNSLDFNEEHRIYIMTGPNRGGKTTFTQAIGLMYLLAQHGIFVPASEFWFSPCDTIYTHFPADENKTVDLGRLGEESVRLSEIMQNSTENTLVLMNETLATTNVEEGVYLARDIVRFMCYIGVRAIYNTHMHDLARNLEAFNSDPEIHSRVESLVTGIENGRRSFLVQVLPPQNASYARDIAIKYGITFEQLKQSRELK